MNALIPNVETEDDDEAFERILWESISRIETEFLAVCLGQRKGIGRQIMGIETENGPSAFVLRNATMWHPHARSMPRSGRESVSCAIRHFPKT